MVLSSSMALRPSNDGINNVTEYIIHDAIAEHILLCMWACTSRQRSGTRLGDMGLSFCRVIVKCQMVRRAGRCTRIPPRKDRPLPPCSFEKQGSEGGGVWNARTHLGLTWTPALSLPRSVTLPSFHLKLRVVRVSDERTLDAGGDLVHNDMVREASKHLSRSRT